MTGVALGSNFVWTFTTGATTDVIAPTVIATGVYGTTGTTSGATGLPVNRASTATFSEAMDPTTMTAASVTVTCLAPCVNPAGAGSYAVSSKMVSFTPASNLAINQL